MISNRLVAKDNQRTIVLLGILLAIYLAGRLFLLMRLPPLIDEGLHSYFVNVMEGGIISAGAGDGKWLSILIFYGLTRLPANILLVIRLASVAFGAATLVAIFLTGRELHNTRAGLLAALFYVFLPYALFYNRLALTDGVAVAFGAWVLLISIRTLRSDNGLYSVLLTALLLATILAKATGMVFILFPVLALLILLPRTQWRAGFRKILPAVLGASFISVIMLSQDMGTPEILHKTVETRSAGVADLLIENTVTAGGWFWTLLTPLMAILSVAAILSLIIWRRERSVLFLLVILTVALAPYIILASIWYPRYLLFALVPLSLLLGLFWDWLTELLSRAVTRHRGGMISAILLALLLIWPSLYGLRFIVAPEQAHFPTIVRQQFISAWTSGYGAKELAAFLEAEAQNTPGGLLVLRPDHLSHVTYGGLDIFLQDDQQLRLKKIGSDLDQEIQLAASGLMNGQRTVFIFDSTEQKSLEMAQFIRQQLATTQIWRHTKPQATGGLEVWELSGKR